MKKILLFLMFPFSLMAQQSFTAMEAYEIAQKNRTVAGDLVVNKNASANDIKEAITILNKTLVFLDSLPVRELATGNIYLKGRTMDVYSDLAEVYAFSNQKELALDALDKMYALGVGSWIVQRLEESELVESLRSEPRYQAFITKLKNSSAPWKSKAFKTPYQPNLTEEEKIAGLTLLWSQAKFNFVFFENITLDWDQTYLDYLLKIKNTKSTTEYYKVLMSFYAQLKDGHTNVYPPDALSDEIYARPPFRTELIEGRVFVKQVFSDSLLKAGIVPGLEVLNIDNEPVITYAEKNIKPYQSSSTPQDMEIREFSYALLSGNAANPINFEFKDRKGKIRTQTVARKGYRDVTSLKTMTYEVIGDIGYLTINSFSDGSIVKQYDSLFTEISKTKGLIIDVRYNGGGSGSVGFNLIARLTNKPFKISDAKIAKHYSRPGAEIEWDVMSGSEWPSYDKIYYDKPVVVLIGARTFSAAEDFIVAFDYMKRGTLVGQATGGSTGQPVPFDLPGGGSARLCGKRDSYPGGKQFVGVGIKPDVPVAITIKDFLNGKDAAKEKALALLK